MLRLFYLGAELVTKKPLNQADYPYFEKGDAIRLRSGDYEIMKVIYDIDADDVILDVCEAAPCVKVPQPREHSVKESKCSCHKNEKEDIDSLGNGLAAFLKEHGHIGVRRIFREKKSECDVCPVSHICPERD